MRELIKKKIRYTGIQPQYFPRLHYFARILSTDIFVIRDDAQFVRKHKYPDGSVDKSYQAHSPIKQSFGRYLLAIPIQHEGFLPLTSTKIKFDTSWIEDHLKTLKIAYGNSSNFKDLFPEIEGLLSTRYKSLADLNIATILWGILHVVGEKKVSQDMLTIPEVLKRIDKKKVRLGDIKRASKSKSLKDKNLKTNEKIVALCQEFGANVDYCGGTGVAAYVDHSLFEDNGISIEVQDWKCQNYTQLFMKQKGFIPNLSILDLLFNVPASKARSILLG